MRATLLQNFGGIAHKNTNGWHLCRTWLLQQLNQTNPRGVPIVVAEKSLSKTIYTVSITNWHKCGMLSAMRHCSPGMSCLSVKRWLIGFVLMVIDSNRLLQMSADLLPQMAINATCALKRSERPQRAHLTLKKRLLGQNRLKTCYGLNRAVARCGDPTGNSQLDSVTRSCNEQKTNANRRHLPGQGER